MSIPVIISKLIFIVIESQPSMSLGRETVDLQPDALSGSRRFVLAKLAMQNKENRNNSWKTEIWSEDAASVRRAIVIQNPVQMLHELL